MFKKNKHHPERRGDIASRALELPRSRGTAPDLPAHGGPHAPRLGPRPAGHLMARTRGDPEEWAAVRTNCAVTKNPAELDGEALEWAR